MKWTICSYLFIAMIFLASCSDGIESSSEETEEKNLYSEVMAVHDSVMPKTDDIQRLRSRLKSLKTTMMADTIQWDAQNVGEVTKAIQKLEEAYEGMFSWMSNLKQEKDIEKEGYETYYREELVRIKRVRNDMLESIKTGKSVLKKYKNANS